MPPLRFKERSWEKGFPKAELPPRDTGEVPPASNDTPAGRRGKGLLVHPKPRAAPICSIHPSRCRGGVWRSKIRFLGLCPGSSGQSVQGTGGEDEGSMPRGGHENPEGPQGLRISSPMQIKIPNDSDADERRFSDFYQAKKAFRRLSAYICVPLKRDVHNFLSNKK